MTDSRSSSDGEKATVVGEEKKKGFFKRRSVKHDDEKNTENEKDTELTPGGEEKKKPEPVAFLKLFRYAKGWEIAINMLGLVASAAAGAAAPLMSLLFGNLTNEFATFTFLTNEAQRLAGTPEGQSISDQIPGAAASFRSNAAELATYLVVIGIGMFVCTYIYMFIWVYTGEVHAKRLREAYLRAVLRQDVAFFDNTGAGEVATRIQTDTHLVQQGTSEKVALVINFSASFVAGFALAYARSWRLALALSSILPCIAIAGGLMNKFISKYMQLSLEHVADSGSLAEEVISTVRTTKAFGSQKVLSNLYDEHVNKSRSVDYRAAFWHGGGLSVFFFVIYGAYALAFSFGTTLIRSGHANAGIVVNVFLAVLIGSFSLALLAPEMQAITHARAAAANLYETIDRVPDIDSYDPSGEKPTDVAGQITFEGVSFNYPSRPNVPIVKNLSLHFEAGKTTALVGASGSGKSTVISLVERFYDPLSGVVKLDGRVIKTLNLKWLRSQIGLVSQEPVLFATTIRENVKHGLIGTQWQDSSEEEQTKIIQEACEKANAHGFISKLPNGYDTMVGERGFLLSGGQKQRIAIARAIVSDPRILLLDEATSALDTQSEGIVQDALDKASAGRTTITIAHRLSTIKDADMIYVMGDGLVLEKGTHTSLLEDSNGPYARLVQAQKLRETKDAEGDSDSITDQKEDMEKVAAEEIPLGRRNTNRSLASEILDQKKQEAGEKEQDYSLYYLFKRMGSINSSEKYRYILGTICAIAGGMVYPSFGIVYAKGIDGFTLSGNAQRVAGDRNALWLFIIGILATIAIGFQNYYFAASAATLTSRLRSMTFRAILRQDVEYFDREENSTGGLTSSLSDNPQKINGLAGITLGAIIQSLATLIGGIIIGLIFVWKLALISVATAPVLVSAGYIRLRVVVLKDQANKKAHEASAQLACEAAGAIRTVASLTREEDCNRMYSSSLDGPLKQSNRTSIWSNLLYSFSQAASFFVIALIFWYGAVLVSRGEYSLFAFFVGLTSTTFGAIQAGNVFAFVPDISSAKGAATSILKLIDAVPEIDSESTEGKKVDLASAQGHIRFEDVHFRYPTRPAVRVLRGLSLQVEPGTYIALVGASGCGKSTVIQLIERFYDPLAGKIFIDGELINEFNVQEYRKQIALVSQEPTLYAGTVKFNILLGAVKPAEEVTQEEIETACRDANILDFIKGLPDGFDTEVGGKGSQLSGGQKQRIAIARALLRNPRVLLLDEATSALDSNSEKVVQAALDQAAKGRTTIAIAHRLSTIQNADRIYFIKEGRVSESGTHDQLLAQKGDYYEYVQLQALSKAT